MMERIVRKPAHHPVFVDVEAVRYGEAIRRLPPQAEHPARIRSIVPV
jgi:hypothetical protein